MKEIQYKIQYNLSDNHVCIELAQVGSNHDIFGHYNYLNDQKMPYFEPNLAYSIPT